MDGVSNSSASTLANTPVSLRARVSISVAKMEQDHEKAQGEAAVRLMDAAGDVLAREPGKGARIDVRG